MNTIRSYIDENGDALELDDQFFRDAKPTAEIPELVAILKAHGRWGRPPLPEAERKQRVTLYLDPDVLERLREGGRGWQTRANAALRKALGL